MRLPGMVPVASPKHEPTDHARNYAQIAYEFALDASRDKSGKRHCRWVRLAAKRHLDDLKRKAWGFEFDPWHANDVCDFAEKMPHVEGEWDTPTITLEPPQIFILCVVFGWRRKEDGGRRFTNVYIEMARKGAKAEWVENLIPTPSGYTRMADLKPGDLVYGGDGRPVPIVACTEEMTGRECMAVTFATGERIIVAADHLWKVNQRVRADNYKRPWGEGDDSILRETYPTGGANAACDALPHRSRSAVQKRASDLGLKKLDGKHSRQFRRLDSPRDTAQPEWSPVIDTQKIADTITYGARGDYRYSVDVAPAIDAETADLPIPPYTLGAWLGDGTSAAAQITIGYQDTDVKAYIESEGVTCEERSSSNEGSGKYILGRGGKRHSLQSKLRALSLLNNKHIPSLYLRADYDQRLSLLRGLMDSDGTIDKRGRCQFVNCNERLARDVHELVCSLGIKASWRESVATLNGRAIRPSYHVTFNPPAGVRVFNLARKAERQSNRKAGTRSDTRSIVSVEPVESVPVKCIQVANDDGLYLTGRSFIQTHNSTLTAIVAHYCLTCEGAVGPQIIIGATTGEQANKVFSPARKMAEKVPDYREAFGVEVWSRSISCAENGGFIQPINSKSSTQDGWNPHVGILDELHAHKDRGLYDVIKSAFGARKNPLLWVITTAGYIIDGVCYEQRTLVTKILEAVVEADHYFGIIFTLDDESEILDETKWIKANPMIGVTPTWESMRGYAKEAAASPASMGEFKTKRLNIWTLARDAWLNIEYWKRCGGPVDLAELEGVPCWGGMDLASTSDITSFALVWLVGGRLKVWAKHYLPEDTVRERAEKKDLMYHNWVEQGLMVATPGNITDYDYIERDVKEALDRFDIKSFGFDPWNASQLVNNLLADGAPMVEIRQGPKTFHPPMQELERRIKAGTLDHGGNPVLQWMASNVIARKDVNENMAPDKKNSQGKIDGIVAMLEAMSLMLMTDDDTPTIGSDYELLTV